MGFLICIFGSIAALALGWLWLQKQVSDMHASYTSLLGTYLEVKTQTDTYADRLSESRAFYDQHLRDKEETIRHQEARLAQLESERRELTERLWTREVERSRPPAAVPEAEDTSWEAIMRKQIADIEAYERTENTQSGQAS